MSFDFSRNLSGATKYVSDAFSSAKETVTGWYDSAFGDTPKVPETPADQTKAAQSAVQSAGNNEYQQRIQNSLANYNKWKDKETNLGRQQRAQEFLNTNNFAVRLENPQNGDVIAFRVSPESINESRQAIYKQLEPLHMPGAVQVYTHTTPRNWAVSGVKLISRNGVEAEDNLATVNLLRSWMSPYFGKSETAGKDNYRGEMLGAPPPVLLFSAYSDGKFKSAQQGSNKYGSAKVDGAMGILRSVPVVIQSLNVPFNNDVDFIQTSVSQQPFPAVLPLDFQLVETHAPADFSRFNIIDYKKGILEGF